MNSSGDSLACASSNVQHHGGVDAGGGEQLEALLVVGQQLRRRLRPHDRRRVAIERQHDRLGLGADGELADVGDDGLVPEVHAVVGADRDHGAFPGPRWDVEIGDHLHGLRRYPRRRAAALLD